jgi:hypothetical protein
MIQASEGRMGNTVRPSLLSASADGAMTRPRWSCFNRG